MSVLTTEIPYVFLLIFCLVVPISADVTAVCDLECPKNDKGKVDSKCEEVKKDCAACFTKNNTDARCQNIVDRLKDTEILTTPEGLGIQRPATCTKSNPDVGCEVDPNSPVRRKRADPPFHKKYVWHQDKIPNRKECCITTKRVIHFVKSCGKNCYPVYCPLAGGYQFIDEVVCNINNRKQQRKYQAMEMSQPKSGTCKLKQGKKCSTGSTLRTYLVTNVPPQGWWGHCLYDWVPAWFTPLVVPTHCYCEHKLG